MTHLVTGQVGVTPRYSSPLWLKIEAQVRERRRREEAERAEIASRINQQIAKARELWTTVAQRILAEVAAKHGITVAALRGPRIDRKVLAPARFEAAYRLKAELKLSYPQVARWIGRKDHTTALNAVRRHAERHGLPMP